MTLRAKVKGTERKEMKKIIGDSLITGCEFQRAEEDSEDLEMGGR